MFSFAWLSESESVVALVFTWLVMSWCVDLWFMIGKAVLQANFGYMKIGFTYCVQIVTESKRERERIFKITIRQSIMLLLLTCMVCRHAHRAGSGPSRVHSHRHRDTGCGGRRRARDYRPHGDKVVAYDDTDLIRGKSEERTSFRSELQTEYEYVSLVSVCC